MSKNKSSYEGFRRKNSLNSHQANKRNTSMESLQSKIKREDLKLVESLSLQLESFSKRPLTSRNFGQNGLKHVKSCHSIKFYHDQAFQPKLFSIQRPEPNSLKKISYELQDQPIELAEIKRQKFGNLLGFNQFDTIEETRSFCQQEMIEDISPVTLKHSLHEPLDKQNKLLNKRNIRVAAAPRPVYKKQSAAIKNDHLNPKKEKMKHDLTELDKMQKQLQNKKANRDNFTAKLISHKTAVQRQKQAVNVQGLFKDSSKLKLLPNKDIKNQAVKTNSFKHSKSTLPLAKASLPNPPTKLQKTEENIEQQQMVATRMLSDKQKSNLINSLSHLRQIIEKNEICSDSNDQILFHMNSIQKLLTR